MHICLVCNSDVIEKQLRLHFGGNHQLELYDRCKADLSVIDAVLIVEPYIIKGQYLSISTVWKNYLLRHYPLVKLVVAGFNENSENLSYLNLLEVHDNFNLEDFIEGAPVVEENREVVQSFNGSDQVIEKLKLFFTGHNNESIVDAISKIRPALNNAELSLYGNEKMGRVKEPFAEVWQKRLYPKRRFFQHFYSRWYNYKDYFKGLPFYQQLKKSGIEVSIDDLSWVFAQPKDMSDTTLGEMEKKYRQLDAYNRIDDVTKLFNFINRLYINPENAGYILLIDDDEDFHKQMKECFPRFIFKSIYQEEEIVDLNENENFNLILLDLELKKGEKLYSGLDYIKKLKKVYKNTPLAIVTTHNERSIIDHTIMEEGADFFFAKTTVDSEKWTTVFINLMASPKRYSLGDIILFNEIRNWEEKPNILVVEDEEIWFNRYKGLTKDYHFVQATTIQQAKDLIATESFDLIILDLYFKVKGKSVLQGINFLEYLKERFSNIPVFVASVDGEIERKKEISKLGGVKKHLIKAEFDQLKWLKAIQLGIGMKRDVDQLNAI